MEVKQRNKSAKKEKSSNSSNQESPKENLKEQKDGDPPTNKPPGPGSTIPPSPQIFPKHRVWSRIVLVLGVLVVVYFTNAKIKESIFGDFKEDLSRGKGFELKCTHKYTDAIKQFPGINPTNCGRLIIDQLLPSMDPFLHVIKQIVSKHFKNSPPPILIIDIGKWTLNSYKEVGGATEFLDLNNYIPTTKDFIDAFKLLHWRLKQVLQEHYKIPSIEKLHVAAPSFISILSGDTVITDYTSHFTVDQELNNGSFHYSTKVFLSDHPKEDKGGRFIFSDKDNIHRVVHGKKGRAVVYTSGPENIYVTEPSISKQRPLILLTIGFTGNPKQALRNRALLE